MMKILSLVLCLLLLTGCASTAAKLDAAEDYLDSKADVVEDAIETKLEPTPAPALLTKEEAVDIAIKHAGLTEEQISGLRISYELDDGRPEYEVEFFADLMEHDYTIHAETGDILSFDIDD